MKGSNIYWAFLQKEKEKKRTMPLAICCLEKFDFLGLCRASSAANLLHRVTSKTAWISCFHELFRIFCLPKFYPITVLTRTKNSVFPPFETPRNSLQLFHKRIQRFACSPGIVFVHFFLIFRLFCFRILCGFAFARSLPIGIASFSLPLVCIFTRCL